MSTVVQTLIIHVVRERCNTLTSARWLWVPALLLFSTPRAAAELGSFEVDLSPFLFLSTPPVAARKHRGAEILLQD